MTDRGTAQFDPLAAAPTRLDTPLAAILAERIAREGPISFAEWMRACLYHREHGYYRRSAPTVGRDGDFMTSPEVHPIFGAAIGHAIAALWRNHSEASSQPLRVAEVGPGTGALAESMLRHWRATEPQLADTVSCTVVEQNDLAARRICERLSPLHDTNRLATVSDIADLGPVSVIVANELLDALPVHRLVSRAGEWRELFVDHSAARGFHDCETHVSDERLLDPLRELDASDGQIVEVSLERTEMVTALAERIEAGGLLLLFDYGYERSRLYAPWRRDGTLMTFRRHTPSDDPYSQPGETDITCHIDVDQVNAAAENAGLTALPPRSQAEWLYGLGAAVLPPVADADADTNRYLSARRAIETLTDPAGLGRIAVMAYTRGSAPALPGWDDHA